MLLCELDKMNSKTKTQMEAVESVAVENVIQDVQDGGVIAEQREALMDSFFQGGVISLVEALAQVKKVDVGKKNLNKRIRIEMKQATPIHSIFYESGKNSLWGCVCSLLAEQKKQEGLVGVRLIVGGVGQDILIEKGDKKADGFGLLYNEVKLAYNEGRITTPPYMITEKGVKLSIVDISAEVVYK